MRNPILHIVAILLLLVQLASAIYFKHEADRQRDEAISQLQKVTDQYVELSEKYSKLSKDYIKLLNSK